MFTSYVKGGLAPMVKDMVPTVDNVPLSLLAAIGGIALTLIGGWDMPLQALLLMQLTDLATGLARGVIQGNLSSRECYRGTVRKLVMWALVLGAATVDRALSVALDGVTIGYARNGTVWFLVATETTSVIENAAACGVPVPPVLARVLEAVRKLGGQ